MENFISPLKALSMDSAGSSGMGSKPTTAFANDSPTTPRPSLETLSVELQLLILCNAPDLTSLSALIHASPELHRVYAEYRMSVLRDVVTQTLQGIHVDALDAYRSGTQEFQKIRTSSLRRILVEERRIIDSADPPPQAVDWTAELSLDELICIARFHVSVIEPRTEAFAHWSWERIPSKPENEAAYKLASLSGTERRQIQRNLYRIQIYCNMCGSRGVGQSAPAEIDRIMDHLRVLPMLPHGELIFWA